VLEQSLNNFVVTLEGCRQQRGRAILISGVRIDSSGQAGLNCREIAFGGALNEGINARYDFLGLRFCGGT
jgi:hypothetical protein